MTLEEYRQLYLEAKTPELKEKIKTAAKTFKVNPQLGSPEKAGNGYCWECGIESARPDHWNCVGCAGKIIPDRRTHSLVEAQAKLKQWQLEWRSRHQIRTTSEDAQEVFGKTS